MVEQKKFNIIKIIKYFLNKLEENTDYHLHECVYYNINYTK